MSEEGVRLNIRKATLRGWRQEFARRLREQGVAANATERAVRGETKTTKMDGIYRAGRRGASTHIQHRAEEAARCLAKGAMPAEAGMATLLETRRNVERGWRGVIQLIEDQGEGRLAESVSRFVAAMRPPRTEREAMVEQLREHLRRARAPMVERMR